MAQLDGFMMFKKGHSKRWQKDVNVSGETHDMRYGAAAALAAFLTEGYDQAFEFNTFGFTGGEPDYREIAGGGMEEVERHGSHEGDDSSGSHSQTERPSSRITIGAHRAREEHTQGDEATPHFRNIRIEKHIDSASPDLFFAWCCRARFPKVKIVFRKASGIGVGVGAVAVNMNLSYLEFKFADVFVETVDWRVSAGGDPRGDATETLEFSFGAVEMSYTPQTALGVGNVFTARIKGWRCTKSKDEEVGPWGEHGLLKKLSKIL